jgi:hypothetical protein
VSLDAGARQRLDLTDAAGQPRADVEEVELPRGLASAAGSPRGIRRDEHCPRLLGECRSRKILWRGLKVPTDDEGDSVALSREKSADVLEQVQVSPGEALSVVQVHGGCHERTGAWGLDFRSGGPGGDDLFSADGREAEPKVVTREDGRTRARPPVGPWLRLREQGVPAVASEPRHCFIDSVSPHQLVLLNQEDLGVRLLDVVG